MNYRSRLPLPRAGARVFLTATLPLMALTLALGGCGSKDTTVVESGENAEEDEDGDEESTDSSAEGDSASASTTPTTDDSDSTETDPSTTTTTTAFVPMNDSIVSNTCDPGLQDCPEGEKCTGYVVEPGYCCVDANKCVDVIGNQQLGDPCVRGEDNDDCDTGLFCMTVTSGSQGDGVCLAFCDVVTQDCSEDGLPDATCIAFNDGTLPLCQDSCDPITQDCDGELGCYGVGAQGFVCSVPGFEEGQGNDGDECFTIQSCKPGLGCTASEVLSDCSGSRCCSPYCDLSEPDPCTQPEACTPYYEEGTAPPGSENVGICAVPA